MPLVVSAAKSASGSATIWAVVSADHLGGGQRRDLLVVKGGDLIGRQRGHLRGGQRGDCAVVKAPTWSRRQRRDLGGGQRAHLGGRERGQVAGLQGRDLVGGQRRQLPPWSAPPPGWWSRR